MKEYYIDSVNGLDTNNGTQESPFKTIKHFLNIVTADTTGDCYVYLMNGVYYMDFCSMPDTSFNRIKSFFANLYFIGNGIDTKLINTSIYNGAMTYYKSQMNVYFRRMIIELSDPTHGYVMMCYINQYYENILFKNFKVGGYGHFFSGSGYSTYINNCTSANGERVEISTYHGGNIYINNCYGHFYLREPGGYAANYHVTNSVYITNETNNATEENKYLDKAYRAYGVYGGEYKWGSIKLLISHGGKYYTIIDNILQEVTDEITTDVIKEKGIDIDEIVKNQSIIPNEFRLISAVKIGCNVYNIQSTSQLIVCSKKSSVKIAEHIDYFKNTYSKNTNSSIKLAISIDDMTWKGNNLDDLNIQIPLKQYSELTEEELMQWNNAKDSILSNGVDISELESLDFSTLDFEYIRFAYVLSVTNAQDNCNISNLQWQYDSKGTMQLMDSTDVTVEVLSNAIKVIPKVETELMRVNITNGTINGLEEQTTIEDVNAEELNELLSILQ